mgnify:CR=1 FL=1
MKLEAVLKDLEERQVQLEETASHLAKLERENRNLTRQNERLSQERAEAVTEAEQMKALMLHQENELRAVGEAAASEEEPVVEENPVLEEEPEVGKETGEETAEEEAAEVSNEEAEVSEPAAAPEEEVRPVSDEELARKSASGSQKGRLSQRPQIEGYKKDSIGGMSHGFVWGILSLSLKRTGEKCGFGSVKRPGKAEIT